MHGGNHPQADALADDERARMAANAILGKLRRMGLDKRDDNALLMGWLQEDPADEDVRSLLAERIADEEQIVAGNPDAFRAWTPWDRKTLYGLLRVGTVVQTGFPYGFTETQAGQPIGIFGRNRGGKSTVVA